MEGVIENEASQQWNEQHWAWW